MAADLLVVGRIATLAHVDGWGWVEAIAIRDGQVMAAGRRADVEASVGRARRTWAIPPDHAVLPGLTDAHLHLADAARAASELDLTGLDRPGVLDAIAAAHRAQLGRGDADGWLTGHGWSMDAMGGRPRASLLDDAAPRTAGGALGARPPRTLAEPGGAASERGSGRMATRRTGSSSGTVTGRRPASSWRVRPCSSTPPSPVGRTTRWSERSARTPRRCTPSASRASTTLAR